MFTDPAPDPSDADRGADKGADKGADRSADKGADVGAGVPGIRPLSADAELAGLVAAWRAADRAMARVVALAGTMDASQAARQEGMTVDGALRLHTGVTRSEVSTVLTAAQVLSAMPITAGLFDAGVFTWSHIRSLAVQSRRMDAATRSDLDRYLGDHTGRLEALDADGRLAAIDDAVAQHTDADRLADRAERAPEHQVAILTPRLDGTGSLYTDLDPESFATVTGRLTAEADVPLAPPSPGDAGDGLPGYTRTRPSRARQLAEALVRIFERHGTTAAAGVPVRFTVVVDADTVTDQLAGTIATAVAGRPPRMVRRAIDRLGCDAAMEVVIRQGTDLLAAKRYTPEITAPTRRAVAARDQGCRFPACHAPATWCDIHHVIQRAAGGDHEPANLLLLCRTHHTIVHRRGWRQTLGPDGTYTVTRRGRSWTTLPRLHAQLPPPGRAGPGTGPAPPDPGPAPPDPGTVARTGTGGPSPRPRRATRPHPDEPLPF